MLWSGEGSYPNIRPAVLSKETIIVLDEYLRFRHVVRNVYTFEFDAERLDHLVKNLRLAFDLVRAELVAFADFLNHIISE